MNRMLFSIVLYAGLLSVAIYLVNFTELASAAPNVENSHTHFNCNQGNGNDKCNFNYGTTQNYDYDHLNCAPGQETCNYHVKP